MEKKDIKVSIILPTYNGAGYIGKSIESVIKQSFTEWELIVIDDGSTDDTADIVKDYYCQDPRLIYLKNKKK